VRQLKFNYIKNVVTLKLYNEKCIGCKLCKTVCPHRVFEIIDGKANIINKEKCMECGACKSNCPVNAIEVECGVGCATAIMNEKFKKKRR